MIRTTAGIDGIMRPEFHNLEFEELKEATCNFSDDNKLGEGGFGPVYKVGNYFENYFIL